MEDKEQKGEVLEKKETKDNIVIEKIAPNKENVMEIEKPEDDIKKKGETNLENLLRNEENKDMILVSKLENEDSIKYNIFIGIKKKISEKKLEDENFIFENGKVKMACKNFVYFSGQNRIYFNFNSKIIKFSNKKEKIEKYYFIHDKTSLKNALKKTKITHGMLTFEEKSSVKNENYNTNNSHGSQSSTSSIESMDVSDILNSSYDVIEEPMEIKTAKIFSENNFLKRYNCQIISDLDFNFRHLDKNIIKNEIGFNETQNNWYGELSNLYKNNIPYSYIFGPKYIGKTTTVLNYLNTELIPRLYFSLKILSNPNFYYKQWKKYSLYESIYTFANIEQMKKFSENTKNIYSYSDLMEFIFSFIEFVVNFFTTNNYYPNEKIRIIIDDYNQELYDKNYVIENIINYVKDNNKKLHLLIIGEGQYINEKLYRFYSNKTNDFSGVYWNLSIETSITREHKILKIPKYYFYYKDSKIKKEDENRIKNDLTNKFKNINLSSFFIISKYLKSEINIEELKDEFKNIPFQYITINKKINDIKGDILVNLAFSNEIYEDIFENSIKGLMKLDTLKTKIDLFNNGDFGKDGIEFEDIIVEQLWNNTIDFLEFPESNKLKVNDIYELKNNIDDKKDKNNKKMNINSSFPIIIRQTSTKARYYDLLLILNQNNKRYALFIQIGLSKTGIEINTYLANLIRYYGKYKEGIQNLINEQIDSIGFMLIFEYIHQKKLKEKNNNSDGFRYCINNNIDFLILKNYQFYKNLDDEIPIKSFEIENRTLIYQVEEKNINLDFDIIKKKFSDICTDICLSGNKNPLIPLDDDNKNKIINYINKQFEADFNGLNYAFNVKMAYKGFGNFGIIDSDNFDQINIFIRKKREKNEIYFGYNNKVFKISGDNIVEVGKKEINSNIEKYNWDRYLLNKKRKID